MSSPDLPPPFINVPGTANFRDIGNGTTIRKGLVYRSADPSKATPEGLKQMNEELGTVRLPLLLPSPNPIHNADAEQSQA